jgi:hypothetical protein
LVKVLVVAAFAGVLAVVALALGGSLSSHSGVLSATVIPSSDAAGVPSCAPAPVEPGGDAIIDHIWVDPESQSAWCEGGSVTAQESPATVSTTPTPNPSDAAGIPSCAGAPVEPGGDAVIDHIWVDPDSQDAWCGGAAVAQVYWFAGASRWH